MKDTKPKTARAEVAGPVEIVFETATGEVWFVERINVRSDSTDPSVFHLYLENVADQNEVDFTDLGNGDAAEYNPALYVPAGAKLIGRWETVTIGATCSMRVQMERQPASTGR